MSLAQFTASIRGRAAPPSRPSAVEAIYAAAHWLLARDRPADAAKVFRVMVQVVPRDERAWLGLGECHERVDQLRIAAELYAAGSVIAGRGQSPSVRCLVARARALFALDRDADTAWSLDAAARAATEQGDEDLSTLVENERRRLS
jgi:Tetratricopeptide repeat